jgi:uncharacterized protein (TIGR03086 family)
VTTYADRWRRVAGQFTDRVDRVPDDAWDNPAPCEGWVARDVVGHLTTWVPAFFERADLALPTAPSAGEDPAGAWHALSAAVQSVLDTPDVAGREFDGGPPGRMTVERAIDMLVLGDVVVHTWDLARAAGLDDTLDPEFVAEQYAGMEPLDEILRASGHFGPKVPVPDDAPLQTKLIAFSGRDPAWRPE